MAAAVEETSGEILTFADTLIEATYFSSSGGHTEAAIEVWGTDYPYLQSVPSPEEMEDMDTVSFTPEAFADKLGICLEGAPEDWFSLTEYTQAGSVRRMVICGVSFSGNKLRQLLKLQSTAFDAEATEDKILITTRGHGHRVGMSQYGADAMADSGSGYREILAHYYPGTQLQTLEPDRLPGVFREKKTII